MDIQLSNCYQLMVDGKQLPFSIDYTRTMFLYKGTKILVKIANDTPLETFQDPTYKTYTFVAQYPEYSNILTIEGSSRYCLTSEAFADLRQMQGFTYDGFCEFYIKFNMETEEGNKAFGLVNEIIKQMRMAERKIEIEKDFVK